MDVKEFEIPVPWGHVAVKCWGNEENIPVLVIHGIGDNAGSFDRLIPYLPISFYYICIDLPDHGKSSPYPQHLITIFDNIYTIKLLVDHLDRKKYIFMGHSWGGQSILMFTQLYPEYALKLILIEAFYAIPIPTKHLKEYLTKRLDSWIKINKNMTQNKSFLYTYEEAIKKVCSKRLFGKGLTREAAEPILKRLLILDVVSGKFMFSYDSQLKRSVNPLFNIEFIESIIETYPITCPTLFVYVSESIWLKYYNFGKFVTILKNNKECVLKEIAGDDHEIHNNNPEIVGPIVYEFLNNLKNKL